MAVFFLFLFLFQGVSTASILLHPGAVSVGESAKGKNAEVQATTFREPSRPAWSDCRAAMRQLPASTTAEGATRYYTTSMPGRSNVLPIVVSHGKQSVLLAKGKGKGFVLRLIRC